MPVGSVGNDQPIVAGSLGLNSWKCCVGIEFTDFDMNKAVDQFEKGQNIGYVFEEVRIKCCEAAQ